MRLPSDGRGSYFVALDDWTAESGRDMDEVDAVETEEDQNGMFKIWRNRPMKPITSHGILAKPTTCV